MQQHVGRLQISRFGAIKHVDVLTPMERRTAIEVITKNESQTHLPCNQLWVSLKGLSSSRRLRDHSTLDKNDKTEGDSQRTRASVVLLANTIPYRRCDKTQNEHSEIGLSEHVKMRDTPEIAKCLARSASSHGETFVV